MRERVTTSFRGLLLASLQAYFGFYEAAEEKFRKLLGSEPAKSDPRVAYAYAYYFWQTKDTAEGYERAMEIYRRLLEAEPGFPGVSRELEICRAGLKTIRESKYR